MAWAYSKNKIVYLVGIGPSAKYKLRGIEFEEKYSLISNKETSPTYIEKIKLPYD